LHIVVAKARKTLFVDALFAKILSCATVKTPHSEEQQQTETNNVSEIKQRLFMNRVAEIIRSGWHSDPGSFHKQTKPITGNVEASTGWI